MNMLSLRLFALPNPVMIAWWRWDPDPTAFTIPFIHHPVAWYGLFFAVGCLFAYVGIARVFSRYMAELPPPCEQTGGQLAEHFSWYAAIGLIVGARLGHVLFYQWSYYAAHPADIVKIWEGGLASHGGIIGVLLAAAIFRRRIRLKVPQVTFLRLLDAMAVPAGITAGCIRVGNFFNQEIVGIQTSVPWAVVFGRPQESRAVVPRHPVQLYEALVYFSLGLLMWVWWRRSVAVPKRGLATGWVLVVTGVARIVIEFFKEAQTAPLFEGSPLLMGQYLSLPFIVLGTILIALKRGRESL